MAGEKFVVISVCAQRFGFDRLCAPALQKPRAWAGIVEHEAEPLGRITTLRGRAVGSCRNFQVATEGSRHRDEMVRATALLSYVAAEFIEPFRLSL